MKQAFSAQEGSIPPPMDLRQGKYFCYRCQSSTCAWASQAEREHFKAGVYLPLPTQARPVTGGSIIVASLLRHHRQRCSPGMAAVCGFRGGSACHRRQIVRGMGSA